MRITRRRLFATIAAAIVGKPAVEGLPLALVRTYDPRPRKIGDTIRVKKPNRCQCLHCQYVRGMLSHRSGYEFYPQPLDFHRDVFTAKTKPLINPES